MAPTVKPQSLSHSTGRRVTYTLKGSPPLLGTVPGSLRSIQYKCTFSCDIRLEYQGQLCHQSDVHKLGECVSLWVYQENLDLMSLTAHSFPSWHDALRFPSFAAEPTTLGSTMAGNRKTAECGGSHAPRSCHSATRRQSTRTIEYSCSGSKPARFAVAKV
jgi:hypothetical protein